MGSAHLDISFGPQLIEGLHRFALGMYSQLYVYLYIWGHTLMLYEVSKFQSMVVLGEP